jgi:glycosyltransferase involved in cell wall biosynthesis
VPVLGGPAAHIILVVPCYNEAARLDRDAYRDYRPSGHRVDLLFVDDGSTDATPEVLQAILGSRRGADRLLRLPRNSGKAEAVRQGLLAAIEQEPHYVGFWDADLATPLDDVTVFADILDEKPALHMVFGARVKLLGRRIDRNPVRHYAGRAFATVVSLMLRLPVYDTQCGAKLFRVTDALRAAVSRPFLSRWVFDVEILARYRQSLPPSPGLEGAVYELPLLRWHDVSGSKLTAFDFVKAGRDLWRIHRVYLRAGARKPPDPPAAATGS